MTEYRQTDGFFRGNMVGFLSFMAAAEFSLHPFGLVPIERFGEVTDLALVVGGLTGAFTIICAVSLLLNSNHPWQRRMLRAFYWTPVGALLAVVGWALGPSLGIALWQIIHSLNLTPPTETVGPRQSKSHVFPFGDMAGWDRFGIRFGGKRT